MPANLFRYEHIIRVTLGLLLLVPTLLYGWWVLLLIALPLIYTAALHSCPLYALLGVNTEQARENYYLSQLPIFNPEPVLLFDSGGKMVFQNSAAKKLFPDTERIGELIDDGDFSLPHLLKHRRDYTRQVQVGDATYMIQLHPAQDVEHIYVYAVDITEVVRVHEEIVDTQKELIYRMGEIGETRSKETGQHVKRVAEYSYLLATLYGLDAQSAQTLRLASPMHDIGKVGIPDAVLKKPGRLNAQEWEIMKDHAAIGRDLLKHSTRPILQAAAIVAGQHHEKFDGSGYPEGFSGEEIHIYGRITAVADVFDALGSVRVYKKAWPMDDILRYFREQSGKHFDPKLTTLLLDHLDEFLAIRDAHRDVCEITPQES
jgi:putative two-component system response regulator